jgi:hypothetical protein
MGLLPLPSPTSIHLTCRHQRSDKRGKFFVAQLLNPRSSDDEIFYEFIDKEMTILPLQADNILRMRYARNRRNNAVDRVPQLQLLEGLCDIDMDV